MNFIDSLKGYKTYGLALLAIVYGLSGFYTGNLDASTTIHIVWTALTAIALRAGIKTSMQDALTHIMQTFVADPTPPAPATPLTLTLSQDQFSQLQAGVAVILRPPTT
jgi:hypothetical protein